MSKSSPRVSIIACHHTGELLYPFIESVKKNCHIPYELIIVTSDETLALKGIQGCVLYYSKALPAEKRNLGVKISTTPYIAFFDDDVEIGLGCIENMMYTLIMKESCGMVYGKLHKFGTKRFDEAGGFLTWNGFIWSRAEQNIEDTGQYDTEEVIFAGKSASCMIKRSVFEEVGGFDESFGILGEESDLSWRVWLRGYKVYYCPKSIAHHKFNTPLKPFTKFYNYDRVHFNGCRNYITMLIKNLGARNLWIVPIHSLIWLTVSIIMLASGKLKQGTCILRGLIYVVLNIPGILRKRSQIQATRRVDDKTIWSSIYRKTRGAYYWVRFRKYLSSGLHG